MILRYRILIFNVKNSFQNFDHFIYIFSHHMNSNMRRVTTDLDDPGYESGNR
jgi:hypothetical protein